MKMTLPDGQVIERPFAAGAQGFVTTKIEITSDDVGDMVAMLIERPKDLYVHLMQLQARFPERRAPTDPLAKMRLNAEFPVAASPHSRFYDPALADKITEAGKAALKIARSSAYGQIGNTDAIEPGEKLFSGNDAHQAYVDFLTPSPEVLAVQATIDARCRWCGKILDPEIECCPGAHGTW